MRFEDLSSPERLEACLVVSLLKRYAKGGGKSVFVVTPHHCQRREIQSLLQQEQLPLDCLVNTVEKMQGR